MQRARWVDPSPARWRDHLRFPEPVVHAVLSQRFAAAAAAAAFIDTPSLALGAAEPLPNMDAALARITGALAAGERMVIFGDYDLDGIAATALLLTTLRLTAPAAVDVGVRIPSRTAGYGLRPELVEEIAASGATLLICVDCGSSDAANVALANTLGLDVIAFDHHRLTGELPEAIVVTPRLAEQGPYQSLSAAGVVYLAAARLASHGYDLGDGPGVPPAALIDLAMLGTVADVMPLTGVNRALVRDGLDQVRRAPRPGVAALCQRAGIPPAQITSEDIAFKLAPRLNAAGRMDDPKAALALLLAKAPDRAQARVAGLEHLNNERKLAVERIVAAATTVLSTAPDVAAAPIVILHGPQWHAGILGIVAARFVDRLGRPVIVLSDDEGVSRGSARSVPGFDIGAALARCAGLLTAHGGHHQAAGLTLATDDIPRLGEALMKIAREQALPMQVEPALVIDADIAVDQLALETAAAISELEPFGVENPRPLLRVSGARMRSYRTLGADERHLKLHLETARGEIGVIGWNASHRSRELLGARTVDVVVTLGHDYWNGRCRLQVEMKDFRAN